MIDTRTPAATSSAHGRHAGRDGSRWRTVPARWANAVGQRARAVARWVNARNWRFHAVVLGGFLLLGIYVMAKVWISPGGRLLESGADQEFFQYMFAHGERVVFHGEHPFVTERLNAPNAVNLMANTSVLGITIPFAPVTALLGPGVSFALFSTLGLAGTAAAWYWLLLRHVRVSRLAAVIGATFCGFGPGMVSQANGHPNITTQFLVPFIVARVIGLGRGRTVRDGLILGLLLTYQAFINEEVLFFTGMATAAFVAVWALQHRDVARARWRSFAASIGVAAALAAGLLAYPLYVQFRGPQSYIGLLHGAQWTADLWSYVTFPRASFGGDWAVSRWAANAAEETSFFGWPLAVLVAVIVVSLWRDTLVRALVITGLAFASMSLGVPVYVHGHIVSPRGTWSIFNSLPLFTSVTPVRLALVVAMIVGVLLAVAIDRAMAGTRHSAPDNSRIPVRRLLLALYAVALAPLFPLPHYTVPATPVPAFITDGTWRDYVREGQTVVTVPLPRGDDPTAMRWAAYAHLDFTLPGGYFLGPIDGVVGKSARFGPTPRPTDDLLYEITDTGRVPFISQEQRDQAAEDLAYWNAGVVVLDPAHKNARALRIAVTELLGAPQFVGGVWVWDVG